MSAAYQLKFRILESNRDLTEQHIAVLLGTRDGKTLREMGAEMDRSHVWVLKLVNELMAYGAIGSMKITGKRFLTQKGLEAILWWSSPKPQDNS